MLCCWLVFFADESVPTYKTLMLFRFVVILLLIVLTVVLFHPDVRFQDVGSSLLERPVDLSGQSGWEFLGTDGESRSIDCDASACRLFSSVAGKTLKLQKLIKQPPVGNFLRATVRLSSTGVVPGVKSWMNGRVFVVGRAEGGNWRWRRPHQVVSLVGDQPVQEYQLFVDVTPDTDELLFAVALSHASGELLVESFSLTPVQEWHLFSTLRWLLIAGWLVAAAWLFSSLHLHRQSVPAVAFGLLMVFSMLVSHENKAAIHSWMTSPSATSLDVAMPVGESVLRSNPVLIVPTGFDSVVNTLVQGGHSKKGHLVSFFLLALLLFFSASWIWWRSLLGLLGFAVVTEVLQFFSASRTPSVTDMVIDSVGVAAALFLFALFILVRDRLVKS